VYNLPPMPGDAALMNRNETQRPMTGREAVAAVLAGRRPERIVYSPNYWQWFAHHERRGLPPEIAHCKSQLDLLRHLGLDVLSRNLYSDQQTCWLGGLSDLVWSGVTCEERETRQGQDRVFHRVYHTKKGTLTERQRYRTDQSTLVQEKFVVDDLPRELDALEELVRGRRWRFAADRYRAVQAEVGQDGYVVAGELYCPLKMLHFAMNPVNTCYLLVDDPGRAAALVALHEAAMLDLAEQIAAAGVPAMLAMDNLDTLFHTPSAVRQCSASFYEQAARICHAHGSRLLVHACGRQRAVLGLLASLGVDGLEGVAAPPLGDVELDEALRLLGDRGIVTGGISALEFERLRTREAVFAYVRDLFARMAPFAHRFVFSSSCNTPITAPWETLKHFRDAWRELGGL